MKLLIGEPDTEHCEWEELDRVQRRIQPAKRGVIFLQKERIVWIRCDA